MRSVISTLLLVLLLILPMLGYSAENRKVLFILDSSGSMWGQIDGKAKTTIAKEALKGIIDSMPGGFDTGLMT